MIANALLLPWSLVAGVGARQPIETVMADITITNVLLIFGVSIQLIFAAKIRHPGVWALGGLSAWLIVPLTVLGILRLVPDQNPGTILLWTFLGYPFWDLTTWSALSLVWLGIITQWLLLAMLWIRLQKTLQHLKAISQTQLTQQIDTH